MLQYHTKMAHMLKHQRCLCTAHAHANHPTNLKPSSMSIASEASIEGQFNHDDDLGQDPYDPLKTPTDTPVLDESITPIQDDTLMCNVVTEEEDRLLDDKVDNVSITLSQGRRRPANFTSLMYRQEE